MPGSHLWHAWTPSLKEEFAGPALKNMEEEFGMKTCRNPLNAGDSLIYNTHALHRAIKNNNSKSRMQLMLTWTASGDGTKRRGPQYVGGISSYPNLVTYVNTTEADKTENTECSAYACSGELNWANPGVDADDQAKPQYALGKISLKKFPMTTAEMENLLGKMDHATEWDRIFDDFFQGVEELGGTKEEKEIMLEQIRALRENVMSAYS